ncbi:leukotriene A-4 hydrolase [Aphelenchoides avenae]|nr:leukotriene A-4 hydrolase [Aphelenchus avenae]
MSDPSSSANIGEAKVNHIALKWHVDFQEKRITGQVTLDVEATKNTDKIVLDGRDLILESVAVDGAQSKFDVESAGVLGQAITVHTGALKAGDKSQCQAIHARSIVPCMDSPAVKQTYEAEVRVPEGVVCLLSALSEGSSQEDNGDTTFRFKQPVRIPSYLLAIVVGAMEKRDISPRCAVWAESSIVDKAQARLFYSRWEFADTEKMLKAGEDLMGEYIWGRYDMVVLPPTFPFGGMENPCLTFVTPTLIAGDRSLTNVIAHEIAHSWTGNTVTNATWEHFWLNEGFTVFVERKIMGRIYGEPCRQFENITGWEDRLVPTILETFHPQHEYTKLIPNLKGVDPDDAFSTIPYEKGSALLLHIEQQLGSNELFEKFLRDYISKFAGQSIVTEDWKKFLYDFAVDKKTVLDTIDFRSWLNNPGVPPNKPKYDESLVEQCRQLAKIWATGTDDAIAQLSADQFAKMDSNMKVKVLDCIEQSPALAHPRVEALEKKYALATTRNCEVLFSWMLVALKAHWSPIIPQALKFATSQGRMKKLFAWDASRGQALAAFEAHKPFMHPITKQVIQTLAK